MNPTPAPTPTPIPDPSGRTDKRPSHIIVFKAPLRQQENEDLFHKLLKPQCGGTCTDNGSCIQYEPASPKIAASKYYKQMAAAVADLDASQETQLLASERVTVFPNQTRLLRPPVLEPRDADEFVKAAADGAPAAGPALNWHFQKVGATANPFTGAGVKVAILDSGIDTDHPDFGGRKFDATNTKACVEGTIEDLNGHGTHCAGLIIGDPDPAAVPFIPRYGISPKANLLVAKVLNQFKRGDDDHVLAALQWAEDMGAQLISMSLYWLPGANDPLADLIERVASRLLRADPGALIFAAAGNESRRPGMTFPVCNPAAYPSVMAVSAVDRSDHIADFSCGQVVPGNNQEVNFAAPGVGIFSAWMGGRRFLLSGTSQATPIVAGVAARMIEEHAVKNGGAKLRALELKKLLEARAGGNLPKSDFGAGIVHL